MKYKIQLTLTCVILKITQKTLKLVEEPEGGFHYINQTNDNSIVIPLLAAMT